VLADDSISAVGTYEPFLSQALSALPERNPKVLLSSKEAPDLIIDIITARDDLEFGAAEQRLDPALEIDSSILQGLFDNATR